MAAFHGAAFAAFDLPDDFVSAPFALASAAFESEDFPHTTPQALSTATAKTTNASLESWRARKTKQGVSFIKTRTAYQSRD
jgi:hypothetical protein